MLRTTELWEGDEHCMEVTVYVYSLLVFILTSVYASFASSLGPTSWNLHSTVLLHRLYTYTSTTSASLCNYLHQYSCLWSKQVGFLDTFLIMIRPSLILINPTGTAGTLTASGLSQKSLPKTSYKLLGRMDTISSWSHLSTRRLFGLVPLPVFLT